MTMTMTHSSEVANVNQKPGPADMNAGVMTPHKKNLIYLYALLNGQGRLLVLCSRQCTESHVKKDHQAFAGTNSIEFKEVITSTHVCSRKKGKLEQGCWYFKHTQANAVSVSRDATRHHQMALRGFDHPPS